MENDGDCRPKRTPWYLALAVLLPLVRCALHSSQPDPVELMPAKDPPRIESAVTADTTGSVTPGSPTWMEQLQRETSKEVSNRCEPGEAKACTWLGKRYLGGEGLQPDEEKAHRLFVRGCDGGDDEGCFERTALDQDKDPKGAAVVYRRLCEGGMQPACGALGASMLKGKARDTQKAVLLLDGACQAKDGFSCFQLGEHFRTRPGGAERAFAAFTAGCEARQPESCNNLGLLYGLGKGVKQDKALALRYLRRSCELGLDSKTCEAMAE